MARENNLSRETLTARKTQGEIWAVTAFFNPVRYRRRLRNYHQFRRRLNVPLVAVELTFGDSFELAPEDADIVIQRRVGHVMWQKERLLNLAISSLPASCDFVAWLDCDTMFENEDWATLAVDALTACDLVQLFEEVYDLPKDALSLGSAKNSCSVSRSAVSSFEQGMDLSSVLLSPSHRSPLCPANGLAWAARRKLVQECSLYDACILGSGDRAMLCAALGNPTWATKALTMNPMQAEHFLEWGSHFAELVRGRIACVPGRIFHLWHGDPDARQLDSRYEILQPYGFDPATDIELSSDGCWVWATDREPMHEAVAGYFRSRREDD